MSSLLYFVNDDLFLNFSRQETFGKTVVEAQACGVPVLARRIPAFEENVEFGELLDDLRPDSLVPVIHKVLAKSRDKNSMHASMQKYSLEKLGRRYINLYSSFKE